MWRIYAIQTGRIILPYTIRFKTYIIANLAAELWAKQNQFTGKIIIRKQ